MLSTVKLIIPSKCYLPIHVMCLGLGEIFFFSVNNSWKEANIQHTWSVSSGRGEEVYLFLSSRILGCWRLRFSISKAEADVGTDTALTSHRA